MHEDFPLYDLHLGQLPGWTVTEYDHDLHIWSMQLRPDGDLAKVEVCDGCRAVSGTVELTVYLPYSGQPDAQTRSGTPVTVRTTGDGFFSRAPWWGGRDVPTIAWQYAADAWVTVQGLSATTAVPDKLLEVARAFQPAMRTPVRVPFRIATLPLQVPDLVWQHENLVGDKALTLMLSGCADDPRCSQPPLTLSIRVLPGSSPNTCRSPLLKTVVVDGVTGRLSRSQTCAEITIAAGVTVVFDMYGPAATPRLMRAVLANTTWATNPADRGSWIPASIALP